MMQETVSSYGVASWLPRKPPQGALRDIQRAMPIENRRHATAGCDPY
jgi:hypothetical protein